MDPDFPAAHSMDTAWFAMDADGHLGVFETNEEGHMPDQDDFHEEKFEQWKKKARRGEILLPDKQFDRAELLGLQLLYLRLRQEIHDSPPPNNEPVPPNQITRSDYLPTPMIIYLAALTPVEWYLNKKQAVVLSDGEEKVVLFGDMETAPYSLILQSGLCLTSYQPPPSNSTHFLYSHQGDVPQGVYTRTDDFTTPVVLPAHFASLVRLKFPDIRFMETPYVQPLNYWSCLGWGEIERLWYVNENGVMVPTRGFEDYFQLHYDRLRSLAEEFAVEIIPRLS